MHEQHDRRLAWLGAPADRPRARTCSGGILFDPSRERPGLVHRPYGKTWTHGGFTCASATAGITCRNRTGNVLFISRLAWRTS